MADFLVDTPVGPLHKGDTVYYRRRNGEIAVVRASSMSSLTPSIIFGRTPRDKARCVPTHDITRIERPT